MTKNSKVMSNQPVPPPPKSHSKGTKGVPVSLSDSTNLTKKPASELVLINFRVTPEFRRELKGEALARDITVSELLQRMYACWCEHHQ